MRQRGMIEDTRTRGRSNGGARSLAGRAGKVVDEVEEVAEEAEGMLRRYMDRAVSGGKTVDRRVRGFASEHPVATLLIALGVGYGLGYLIYRRARSS